MLSLKNGFKLLGLLGKIVVIINLSHELRVWIFYYMRIS
jgi:hypothetical protein